MHFEYVAIPDAEVPRAAEPTFEHALDTYASEANKTVSMWRAMTDGGARLPAALKGEPDPHHPRPPVLSERQFFVEFAGLDEPAVEELMPTGEKPGAAAYVDKYVWLAKRRLPQFASGTTVWRLKERPFFGGLVRQQVWVFWRRVLHTCHHRTAGAELAATGRARAGAGDLRAVRRRDLGLRRPHRLARRGPAG